MNEFRRLKMKIGEAEFEADVLENEIQPMYCQFLSLLERRGQAPVPLSETPPYGGQRKDVSPAPDSGPHDPAIEAMLHVGSPAAAHGEAIDHMSLGRVFVVHDDGAVTLKVLPGGPETYADAMVLLLYGHYRLRNETFVLATRLFRAAEQSGIPLRRPTNEYVRNSRFVVRGGNRKGSHYSLSSQGLTFAEAITARMIT